MTQRCRRQGETQDVYVEDPSCPRPLTARTSPVEEEKAVVPRRDVPTETSNVTLKQKVSSSRKSNEYTFVLSFTWNKETDLHGNIQNLVKDISHP